MLQVVGIVKLLTHYAVGDLRWQSAGVGAQLQFGFVIGPQLTAPNLVYDIYSNFMQCCSPEKERQQCRQL